MDFIVNAILILFAVIALMMFIQNTDFVPILRARSKKKLSAEKQELMDNIRKLGFTKFDISKYSLIRNVIFIAVGVMLVVMVLVTGQIPYIPTAIAVILYVFTAPSKFGLMSVFLRTYKNSLKAKKNEEVFRIILQLKNLAALNVPENSTEILMSLAKECNALRPEFAKLLREWVNNNRTESVDEFVESVGTQHAVMLGSIIKKLEDVPIGDLYEEIRLYQDVIFEEKQTAREKKDGRNGDMFFAFVTAIFFVIMIDFVIIMVFGMLGDFMGSYGGILQ